jgi:hypothetical protein
MRNLSVLSYAGFSLPQGKRTTTGVALDVDLNLTYTVTERYLANGEADIEIWQLPVDEDVSHPVTRLLQANSI